METTGADANDEFARWLAETAKAGQGAVPATPPPAAQPGAPALGSPLQPCRARRRPCRPRLPLPPAAPPAGAMPPPPAPGQHAAPPAPEFFGGDQLAAPPTRPYEAPFAGPQISRTSFQPAGDPDQPPAAAPFGARLRRLRSRPFTPDPPAAPTSRCPAPPRSRPQPSPSGGAARMGPRLRSARARPRPRPRRSARAQHTVLPVARNGGPRVRAARLPVRRTGAARASRHPACRPPRRLRLRLRRLRRPPPRTRLPRRPPPRPPSRRWAHRPPISRPHSRRWSRLRILRRVSAPHPAPIRSARSSRPRLRHRGPPGSLAAAGDSRAAAGGAAGRRTTRRRGPAVHALRPASRRPPSHRSRPRSSRPRSSPRPRSRRRPTCSRRRPSRPRPRSTRRNPRSRLQPLPPPPRRLEPEPAYVPDRGRPRPAPSAGYTQAFGSTPPPDDDPNAGTQFFGGGTGSYEEPPDLDRTTTGEKVAFALAFVVPPVGLIASIVAAAQSARRRGWVHGFVKAALAISIVTTIAAGIAGAFAYKTLEDQQRHAAIEAASTQFCATVAEQPDMITPPTFGFPGPGPSIPDTVDVDPGVHRSLATPSRTSRRAGSARTSPASRTSHGRSSRRSRRRASSTTRRTSRT